MFFFLNVLKNLLLLAFYILGTVQIIIQFCVLSTLRYSTPQRFSRIFQEFITEKCIQKHTSKIETELWPI